MSWVRIPPEQLFFHFPWKKRCSGLLYCLALNYVGLTISVLSAAHEYSHVRARALILSFSPSFSPLTSLPHSLTLSLAPSLTPSLPPSLSLSLPCSLSPSQPEITKGYGTPEWKDDLKSLLNQVGKEGKTTVFLLTDTQIKQESFLEDVDGLLNAGEVPNLFALDEKQEILEVRMYVEGRDGDGD